MSEKIQDGRKMLFVSCTVHSSKTSSRLEVRECSDQSPEKASLKNWQKKKYKYKYIQTENTFFPDVIQFIIIITIMYILYLLEANDVLIKLWIKE